jgi:uncharacterized protein YerC
VSAPSGDLTTYGELATILDALPLLLREGRRYRRLSMRAAAEQMGLSFSTLSRVESGSECVLSAAVTILRWLDQPREGT